MDINVYFLDSEESDPDANAYQYVKEHIREENIHIVSYSQGFKMIENDKFVKQDVFVLEKFEGSFFEHLQKTKALVVGPRCLIKCLINCEQIPLGKSPVFTTAMRDLHISATGFTGDEKEKMRNLISWMGGYYYSNFGRNVTHLVANTIKSTKYEHAAVNGIPIMHPDWVEAVWQKSKTEDTEAKNEEYNKYRLPIFYNLNITCSGLTNERKEQVMQLINENGGIFNRAFRSQITDVVLIEKDKTNSDKYKAAISYKKDVLLPEWIIDSVEAGYALPTKKYIVKSVKVSTPTKNDHTISDMTQLSGISMISTGNHNYDQTVNDSLCSMANMTVTTAQPVRNILAEVMSSDYKKAGLFLDGCSVYISGFKNDEKEKLNRILNTSGATRFDEMEDDNLTHIIVAPNTCDKKIVALGKSKDIHVVTLNWLLESIKQKQPAKESNYQVEIPTEEGTTDCPSPSSKKTLKSMNHSFSFKQPDLPKKKLNFEAPKEKIINQFPDDNDENDLLQQYQNSPSLELPPIPTKQISNPIIPVSDNTEQSLQMDSCATVNTLDYENLTFLEGMSVFIVKSQFDEEFYTQIIFECESAKGKVVSASYKDVVDYVLVSFEKASDFENLPIRAKNIVNELWIESSMKENIQVPIQYFHHPIPVTVESKPLSGMTIVISTYTDIERDFVDSLANLLGAQCKKLFAKKEMPLLICPLPEGNKYEGALKWKFPVVTSKYLVDCAKYGEKLPYDEYLVGDSVSDFPNSSKSTPKVTPKTPVANFKTPVANSKTPNIEPMESTVELHTADFTNLTPTTTNEFTPLRNKRVSELAGPKRKSLPSESPMGSPHTPASGSYKCYDAFEDIEDFLADITDENERNCLRECILEMKENQTPEIERIKRMACTPVNRRLSIPKGIPDFCTTPEFQKRMWEAFDRRWHLSAKKRKPTTPLDEVRKRVFKATFEKYGLDPETSMTPSRLEMKSRRIDTNSMEIDESSVPSPSCKQLSDFIKSCEDKRHSLKNDTKEKSCDEFYIAQTEQMHVESEPLACSEAMVGWKDPAEFSISRRPKIGMHFVGKPCFSISCANEDVKNDIIEKIKRLRGDICSNLLSYDPKCTHFLLESPNRGEKFLSCLSAGKWILTLDYINDSFDEDRFLDEELYEWGNDKSSAGSDLSTESKHLARAAFYWRERIMRTSENQEDPCSFGAFKGYTVILKMGDKFIPSFTNVVKAGKGSVVNVSPPYNAKQLEDVTHCFVDVKKCPLDDNDKAVLKECGVQVFSHMYMNSYLLAPEKNASLENHRVKL